MECVVLRFTIGFLRSDAEAFTECSKSNKEGLGIAGTYSYEIANMKPKKQGLWRRRGIQLLCTVEEE